MQAFARMGAELGDAWRAVGRDEERFAALAAHALSTRALHERFERERFLDECLDPRRSAGLQLASAGAFGQPGQTVHHGEGFVIEVYYWLNSLPAIHNHPFSGAFTVLEGWSVHARYGCEELEPRAGGAATRVELEHLALVQAGEVVRFSPRAHPLIHALVHVPVPSLSLVARTVRTAGYLRFLPPTLALPMEPEPEPAARRLALLEALGAAGDPRHPEHLARELARADLPTAVRLLSAGWSAWDAGERAAHLELLRPLHGASVDALPPALDQAARTAEASAIRERLRDADLRLVATALAYADTRARVLQLLAQRGEPLRLLHRFVDEAELFTAEEAASASIARALVDGEGVEGALRSLARDYGAEAVLGRAEEVERYCSASIFAALAL